MTPPGLDPEQVNHFLAGRTGYARAVVIAETLEAGGIDLGTTDPFKKALTVAHILKLARTPLTQLQKGNETSDPWNRKPK